MPPRPDVAELPVSGDPLIGDLRRAGLLPLLVLHYMFAEACYGNQLMERIGELTGGALAVNPNTMYPLLRSLEAQGLVAGGVGAPRAALAALLPDHRGRARRARAAGARSSARGSTGSPARSTRSATRCSADGPRVGLDARCPGSRPRPRRSGTTRSAGPRGSTASATSSSCPTGWPAERPARVEQRRRAGRGRVIETSPPTSRARPDARGRGQPPARTQQVVFTPGPDSTKSR